MRGRVEFAHQSIDLASGNCHDNSLNGSDFFVRDVLFPGHAKVVLDSWLALPGYCRGQSDHRCGAGIKIFLVADGIVEIAVGFMLFVWQHNLNFCGSVYLKSRSVIFFEISLLRFL